MGRKLLMAIIIVGVMFGISHAQGVTQTTITVWHALPSQYTPLFESLLQEYTKETHGTVAVKFRKFENQRALIDALMKEKTPPDIALIDTRWQKAIYEKKPMVFAEDLMLNTAGRSVYIVFKMDTFKPMWKSSSYNGKLLTLPFTGYNRALILNEKIFSNLKIKKVPANWQDIVRIGRKIIQQNKGVCPFTLPVNGTAEETATFFQVSLWQIGRDIFHPFMDGELANLNSREKRAVLKFMVDLVHKYGIAPLRDVNKAQVAMFIGTPMDYISLCNSGESLKVVRWPGKKRSANDLIVYSFAVFDTHDKKKLEKIWHILYKACEFESTLKWTLNTPYLPHNKQVTLSPKYFEYVKKYPGIKIFVQQLKNSKVCTTDEKKEKIMKYLGANLKEVLWGRMTIEDALSKSEKYANTLLDPSGKLRARKSHLEALGRFVDQVWRAGN